MYCHQFGLCQFSERKNVQIYVALFLGREQDMEKLRYANGTGEAQTTFICFFLVVCYYYLLCFSLALKFNAYEYFS